MIMFGSFLPSPLLVGTTKFNRAWEPTLLWNRYTNDVDSRAAISAAKDADQAAGA